MISILSDILNFLFPRYCVKCGRRLNAGERSICTTCVMHLPRTDYHVGKEQSKLEKVFWTQFPVERAASFFYYKGEDVRHMLHALKYYDQPEVGFDLACIAAEELAESGFFDGVDCIVPVPIHWRRMLRRNYNQSLYIAKGLRKVTGIPIYNNVVRRRVNNISQTRLKHRERKENTENIFALVGKEKIIGKHILLVDDVITTGSTVASCAKTLALADNVRISVFSLARAVPTDIPQVNDHTTDTLSTGVPLLD